MRPVSHCFKRGRLILAAGVIAVLVSPAMAVESAGQIQSPGVTLAGSPHAIGAGRASSAPAMPAQQATVQPKPATVRPAATTRSQPAPIILGISY